MIKENPLWEVGAILTTNEVGNWYEPINDVWNRTSWETEYLSSVLVETQPEFFERVYQSNIEKALFLTKESMIKMYKDFISWF